MYNSIISLFRIKLKINIKSYQGTLKHFKLKAFISPSICVIFDFFHQCFIVFFIYRSFVSLGRFIPKYFILFAAVVNENEYATQSNLQIQCNPYQAPNGIFQRTRTNNFTISMEIQKTLNSQSNLEKEEWNRRNQPA